MAVRILLSSLLVALALVPGTVMARVDNHSTQISNSPNCDVVQHKTGEGAGNSTSVTAGNGRVSAQANGGNGVTVHSGNNGVSTSAATTGSGGTTTTVRSSNGNCTIQKEQ